MTKTDTGLMDALKLLHSAQMKQRSSIRDIGKAMRLLERAAGLPEGLPAILLQSCRDTAATMEVITQRVERLRV